MIKSILSASLLGLAMTACVSPEQQMAHYSAQCADMGYPYGSQTNAQCAASLMDMQSARSAAMIANGNTLMRASAPAPNPGQSNVICSPSGGSVICKSY